MHSMNDSLKFSNLIVWQDLARITALLCPLETTSLRRKYTHLVRSSHDARTMSHLRLSQER